MSSRHISDERLIDLYLAGNHSCIETLIHRYKEQVFEYIILHVRNEHVAEDLFQDTFIKIIKGLRAGSYNDEGKFLAWANTIAHNIIVDYWRKSNKSPLIHNREENDILDSLPIHDKSYEEIIITQQIHSDVKKLLDFLPEDQRAVVMMRHFAGMSFKDIAEETNESINTVLGRMRYALRNLRRLIKEKELILTY